MIRATRIIDRVEPNAFLGALLAVTSTKSLRDLLATLPIAPENSYLYSPTPEKGWTSGLLHWLPVGRDLGNAGRIKLASFPENPIAERTVNMIEAIIELERLRELKRDPSAAAPKSPREAALRYFDLPSLEAIPDWPHKIRGQKAFDYAREMARRIRVRLHRALRPVEYAVLVEDDGLGQPPARMHETLLSLGSSEKPEKPYLIGEYGQGGSSAYAACDLSWLVSRRAPDLLDGADDGIGFTVVKQIIRPGRRGSYWAYLSAHPDGSVPSLPASCADAIGFAHGTRIAHLAYDFGKTEPARTLYQTLNHLLFSPVLPYELYTKKPGDPADPMWGNAYRLSSARARKARALNKVFESVEVYRKGEAP